MSAEKVSCFKCKAEIGKDNWCYGCHNGICDSCEVPDSVASWILGAHDPEDHFIEHEAGA